MLSKLRLFLNLFSFIYKVESQNRLGAKTKIQIKILLASFVLVVHSVSWAYIPQLALIITKANRHHGKGAYKIEQYTTFYHGPKTQTLKEIWTIIDGTHMAVQVKGTGKQVGKTLYAAIYKNGLRHWISPPQKLITDRLGQDWFNSYFHYRKTQKTLNRMYVHRIIPEAGIYRPQTPSRKNNFQRPPQHYVRLGRTNGSISYAIGQPSTKKSLKPGLWIEQDSFLIQKIRLPSQATISAQKYAEYARGLWLPQRVSISWKEHRAKIKLYKVRKLAINQARSRLNLQDLQKKDHDWLPISDPVVSDFYQTFR